MPRSQRISALFENVAEGLADEVATLAGQLRKEVAAVARGVEEARAKDLVRLSTANYHVDDLLEWQLYSDAHAALHTQLTPWFKYRGGYVSHGAPGRDPLLATPLQALQDSIQSDMHDMRQLSGQVKEAMSAVQVGDSCPAPAPNVLAAFRLLLNQNYVCCVPCHCSLPVRHLAGHRTVHTTSEKPVRPTAGAAA